MSWYRTALNITTIHEDSYYTTVDPGDFYEWRFTQRIPKDTIFTKSLPPSEVFTKGLIIATARLNHEDLVKQDFGYKTSEDTYAEIMLQAGQVQSPAELIERLRRLSLEFKANTETFKKECSTRQFYIAGSEPSLYQVKSLDDGSSELMDYGEIDEITKKLKIAIQSLRAKSEVKEGRAHELEALRRFENALTFLENKNLPVLSSQVGIALRLGNLKPLRTTKMSWADCYATLDKNAQASQDLIQRHFSLSWVKSYLQLI